MGTHTWKNRPQKKCRKTQKISLKRAFFSNFSVSSRFSRLALQKCFQTIWYHITHQLQAVGWLQQIYPLRKPEKTPKIWRKTGKMSRKLQYFCHVFNFRDIKYLSRLFKYWRKCDISWLFVTSAKNSPPRNPAATVKRNISGCRQSKREMLGGG